MSRRQALRRSFRALRQGLSPATQKQHSQAVASALRNAPELQSASCVAGYLATDGELDLGPLITELRNTIALPRVGDRQTMTFHRYLGEAALTLNRFGIAEPTADAPTVPAGALDVLLIPLVAFDAQLTRLGRGGGYYDRFLAQYPTHARPLLIGVAHACQLSIDPLPMEPWDVPLNAVVTEDGWHRSR